jgi:ribosomal protein S18 acetylase RimI-like enzyme
VVVCERRPGVDWSSRIRIWTDGGRTVGWGWFKPPAEIDWFAATDLGDEGEREVRRAILDWGHERTALTAAASSETEPLPALKVWAADGWPEARLLADLGYSATDESLTQYFQSLERELPEPVVPAGYRLRSVTGPQEIAARVEVHRSAFAPSRMTVEKYEIVVGLPGYRYDLDTVVEAPDGSFAAFTMAWLDREAALGYFEPVGTHQDHQRRGLGKAVQLGALRRLRDEAARDAMVYAETADPASNGLYRSVGFGPIATHRMYVAPGLQSGR